MASGSYYIYGISDDGINPPASAYSSGQVTIDAPPASQRIMSISENLKAPTAVAVGPSGKIYVTEAAHNRLHVYSPSGYYIKSVRGLGGPVDVEIDASGKIFLANTVKRNVSVYDADFNLLSKLGSGDREFGSPCSIDIDSTGNVYVADCREDKIKIYNPGGLLINSFGVTGSGAGQLNYPSSVVVDEAAGEIIVSDIRNKGGMMGSNQEARIQIFNMSGAYLRTFGVTKGLGEGKIVRAASLEIDSSSRMYVSDSYQHLVQSFLNTGTSLGAIYDIASPVKLPVGIKIGSNSKLFVVSQETAKVEVYGIDSFKHMEVSPLSLSFQEDEGSMSTDIRSVQITNRGNEAFGWTASTNHTWITLSQASGTLNPAEMTSLDVGVDVMGLSAGTYAGNIEIINDAGELEVVNVTLEVIYAPIPELSVNPNSLEFTSTNGSVPAAQGLSIENIGGGTLNWTASADQPWLLIDKSSGTAPDTVNAYVDPAALTEGIYTGNITVTAPGATRSPEVVPVTLNVVWLTGTINVNTNNAAATFVISGPTTYAGNGTSMSVSNAFAGTYTIVFGAVTDYSTPSPQVLTLVDGGTITFSGQYIRDTATINVTTNNPAATFDITGPASYSGSGTSWSMSDAPTGTYQIVFGDVPTYIAPSLQTDTLVANDSITFYGQYDPMNKNIIAGYGHGQPNLGTVKVLNSVGSATGLEFNANTYEYGVNIASGDIDGDGIDEIITAPGPNPIMPAELRIYDRNGTLMTNLSMFAFDNLTYLYGGKVASADFDVDGHYEVIAGTGPANANEAYVKIFVYNPATQKLVDSGIDLFPYTSNFGANVAAGDIDGDGTPELITSPGPGSKNLGIIKVWTIDTSLGVGQWSTSLVKEFTVQAEYKYSVTIASGDVNGDGKDEIITGDGPHNKARDVVRVFDQDGVLLNVWQAGTAFDGYGAIVASGDLDNDGIAEILVAPGPGSGNQAHIKIFEQDGTEILNFYPFNTFYGATVAVGNLGLE
jgi:hypothetical protein